MLRPALRRADPVLALSRAGARPVAGAFAVTPALCGARYAKRPTMSTQDKTLVDNDHLSRQRRGKMTHVT